MRHDKLWYLHRLELFAAIPAERLLQLTGTAAQTTYAARAKIPLADEGVRTFVVASGSVKLSRVGFFGRQMTEAILERGDVFGTLLGTGKSRAMLVECLEETTILDFDSAVFSNLVREEPNFAFTVLQLLEDRQRRLERRIESLIDKDLLTRVVETLLWLAREHGHPCEHGWAMDLRITQQDLADLVGGTRQAVNAALGRLERRLLLSRKGRVICLLSMNRLQKMIDVSA